MQRRRIVLAPSFFNNISPPSTQKSEQDMEKGDASSDPEILKNTEENLKQNSVSVVTNENGMWYRLQKTSYIQFLCCSLKKFMYHL